MNSAWTDRYLFILHKTHIGNCSFSVGGPVLWSAGMTRSLFSDHRLHLFSEYDNLQRTPWSPAGHFSVFVVDLIPAIFFFTKKRMCIWKQMILYYNSSSLMSSSTCVLFKFCRIFTAFNRVLHHKEKWQMVEERFTLKNGVGKQWYKKLEGFIFRADDESWFNHIPEMFTELSTSCASLLELK